MKQKGLIEFNSYYPGPNTLEITDGGKSVMAAAEARSKEALDALDDKILMQLSGGRRAPLELQNTLNIRPKDLAIRLYKLFKQNFVSYEMRNGTVDLMLTEQGFLKARTQPGQQLQAPRRVYFQELGADGQALLGAHPPALCRE